jgi:hypothetical protein
MRKIRLDVDHLEVESFVTAGSLGSPGTVRANGVMLGDGVLIGDGFEVITNPQPIQTPNCSADTMCDTCRYSCIDSCTPQPTCDSCHVTMCRANCG